MRGKSWSFRGSVLFVCVLSGVAVLAPWIAPYGFAELSENVFEPPSTRYFFGTDELGRDLFSRILYGARISFFVGALSAVLSVSLGTFYGAVSAWCGGGVDFAMMKFVDLLFAVPTMIFLILVSIVFNSFNIWEDPQWRAIAGISFSLCFVSWMGVARMVRSQVLQIKENLYVEAAEALGVPPARQFLRHVLPNALGPILVMLTFQVPYNILFESFLSFIGLGLQPPYSSWGVLASEGWRTLRVYPHLMIFPGLAIFLTSLSFNTIGDVLRDVLDPSRGRTLN